jgi:hypothetical protein
MLRYLYFILFLVGLYPWLHFYRWFAENGWDLGPMIDAWYVNEATTGITWDLTIAAVVLVIWAVVEIIRYRDWWFLLVIPATFGVGVSAGLPLALFFVARRSGHATKNA